MKMHLKLVVMLSLIPVWFACRASSSHGEGQLRQPLPGSLCPTSSFASKRTGHLHAGLDFSTGGRIGVPVLAVDSCFAWRISVASAGYGKALYVELASGEIALYGHLSRFCPKIEQAVEQEQDLRGTYDLEIYNRPDVFVFSPGETVAYSGETGAGPPHLHFELRSGREDHDKINPFPDRMYLPETSPPVIRKMRITPVGPDGYLNGDVNAITIIPASAVDTFYAGGPFEVSVSAYDVGLCEKTFTPTRYEAWIDDREIWKLEFQEFPFSKSHFVSAFYDRVGGSAFVRLSNPYGLDLKSFGCDENHLDAFFKDLKEGLHTLKVRVGDVWGNYDSFEQPFYYGRYPELEFFSLRRDSLGIVAETVTAPAAYPVEMFYRKGEGRWQQLEVSNNKSLHDARISGPTSKIDVLVKVAASRGFEKQCLLSSGSVAGGPPVRISTVVHPCFLEIFGYTQSLPSALPIVQVREGKHFKVLVLKPVKGGVYRACYFPEGSADVVSVNGIFEFGDRLSEKSDTFALGLIKSDSEFEVTGERFTITLAPTSKKMNRTIVRLTEGGANVPQGFSGAAGRIIFEPGDVVFENALDLTVKSRSDGLTPRHGLFVERDTGLGFLGRFDSFGVCHAKLYTLESLVILEDTTLPVISSIGAMSRRRDGKSIFTAYISDGGSGLDSRTLMAHVDGEPAIAGFDPDTGRVNARSTKRLPSGSHKITLEVKDRMGNTGTAEVTREIPR